MPSGAVFWRLLKAGLLALSLYSIASPWGFAVELTKPADDAAAPQDRREERDPVLWLRASKLEKCLVRLPPAFDSEQTYPLLVALHGNGGSAEGFIRLADFLSDRELIIAAPQGAYPRSIGVPGRMDQYSWEIQIRDEKLWQRGDPLTVRYIMDVVTELTSRFRVGSVYLLGFSQGAAYSYITGIENAEAFNGVIAIGGILPSLDTSYSLLDENDLNSGNGLPILIAHSRQDRQLDFQRSLQAKETLRKYGYSVTFLEYDGGHVLTSTLLEKIGRWIVRQERAATPRLQPAGG